MKKLLLIAAFSLVTTLGFSQGQINFVNTSAALGGPARLVTFSDTGVGVTGTNYLAQLYLASDLSAVLVEGPSPFRISTTTQPGTWNGTIRNFISLYQPGQTLNLVVRVWDGGVGGLTTYANQTTGYQGTSAVFSYTIPAVGSPPAALAMSNFQAFQINPVPEPSTIALGILGAGSLLFLRRKK
jgi:hypothetical protein